MELHYGPLIDRALSVIRVKEKLSVPEDTPGFDKPFITIARDPGSGGAPIAALLAKKLGFELVDAQLVEEIARKTKRRIAIVKEIDEKSRSKIEDLVHSLLNMEYLDEEDYIQELVRAILAYAHKGNCVILGRGGNFITPFARGLHVSITAPKEVRIQRAMDYENLSRRRAENIITKTEEERDKFVSQYFNSNTKQRNSFDLTINTAYFTVPRATEIILQAFKQKFPR